ncbi:MAG: FtsX-like permease family protein [Aestuariivirga sp.]
MVSYLPFEIIAAIRFLREGLVQSFLIVFGVAVGVSVIVFMSALLDGVQGNILSRVLSTQAQVEVNPRKDVSRSLLQIDDAKVLRIVQSRTQRQVKVDQWRKIRDALTRMPQVSVVSPTAAGSVFVVRGGASRTVSMSGIQPEDYYRFIAIPDYMIAGTSRITGQDMLIGKDLADDLGIRVGDKILVRSSSGATDTLNIAGIFDLGNRGFNLRSVITLLNTAQNLLGLVGSVTTIDVTLKDPYGANDVADILAATNNVEADSWIRTNAQFFTAMKTQTVSFSAIRASVAVSVILGIASVLVVSVVQRSREIGILRAMGASQGQMMRVFLVQGAIVGFLGSVTGSMMAWGFVFLWRNLAVNADGTPFFAVTIGASLYVTTAVLATLCGVLAASVPALRASRLDPVVAIRG